MKKRSMLAIASLATGFVVAAITPSHALAGPDQGGAKDLSAGDVHDLVDGVGGDDVLARPGGATGYATGGLGLDSIMSPYNG